MSERLPSEIRLYDQWQVAVCSECKTAACWQGVFYCEEYKSAGVTVMTIGELRKLGPLESEGYWRRDEGIKRLTGTAKPLVERRTCSICTPEQKCPDHGACVSDGEI